MKGFSGIRAEGSRQRICDILPRDRAITLAWDRERFMTRILKWTAALVLGVVVLALAAFVHVWYFKPLSIDWFYDRLFARFALDSPELLSSLRVLPPWLDFYGADLD